MEKNLSYSNLHLSVEAITSDPQLQIKILEGTLAATNTRLKAYIDNEAVLESKITELKKVTAATHAVEKK